MTTEPPRSAAGDGRTGRTEILAGISAMSVTLPAATLEDFRRRAAQRGLARTATVGQGAYERRRRLERGWPTTRPAEGVQ